VGRTEIGGSMSNIKRTYKPGEIVQNSAQMELRGPRGGRHGREVTVVAGEPTPPTPRKGMYYYLSDRTIHKQ
jgi:hypothetical protein